MKKPLHFLILKIAAGVLFCGTIVGVALTVSGFGNFETNRFMVGGVLVVFCSFGAVLCGVFGFRPEIAKLSARSTRYVQSQIKDDLQEISSTQAEIVAPAATTLARAAKEGFTEGQSEAEHMFCKQCGAKIARDSKFCKQCGAPQ